jgi:hypothetical protein
LKFKGVARLAGGLGYLLIVTKLTYQSWSLPWTEPSTPRTALCKYKSDYEFGINLLEPMVFYETVEITYALLVALYPQKLALTSPTSGGRSVGIVRSRTKATEFVLLILLAYQVLSCAYVFFRVS